MNELTTDDNGFVVSEAPNELAPEPKRRGRKPKNAAPETAEMHADGTAPEATEAAEPKRRKAKGAAKDKAATWTTQIQGFYGIAAAVTGVPFLAISPDEAKQLANAAVAVSEEYDFEVAGKYAAIGGLVIALAMVNVPRALMFRQHMMMVRSSKIAPGPEAVQPYVNNAPADPNHHIYEAMPKVDPAPILN